jgi:peptide/nickel transport system substrate-binding protein
MRSRRKSLGAVPARAVNALGGVLAAPATAPEVTPKSRRRPVLRFAAAVAATALLAAGCGSSSSGTSSSGSVKGAVATLPLVTGTGANCIFEFEGPQCYSVANYEDFEYQMVLPLFTFGSNSNTNVTVNYALSPADAPVFKNGGKTVVINLKGWKWSDGQSVNAKDVIFFLNMLEAEKTAYAGYTPGLLPDNLASYSATGPDQVTLNLKTAYGATWFTYNQLSIVYPFPLAWDVTSLTGAAGSGGCESDSAADGWAKCKAVYTFLNAQDKDTATYATSPLWKVVDGPYKLSSYNVDGDILMKPNPDYSGSPKAQVTLKFVEYTSDTAVYTGLRTGALSSDGPNVAVPSTDLASAGKGFVPPSDPLASAGYTLDSAYEYGIGYADINFNNPTYGAVFKQLYFRQALMMLNDQKSMSSSVGRGYYYPTSAGVPPEPPSQFSDAPVMQENGGQGPYPYDPSKAEALLAAHGWKVVGGVLTCESAGTGSADCGAGVAKGLQAKFSILFTSGLSTQSSFVQILKSGFAQAGIQLTAVPETFDDLLPDTSPCKPTASNCKWTFLYLGGWLYNGPGFEPTGEPLYQTGATNNAGGYSNPEMDTLIKETQTNGSMSVFHNYANYSATQVPSLWLPWYTAIYAVSNDLHNAHWSPFLVWVPQYWTCGTATCGTK